MGYCTQSAFNTGKCKSCSNNPPNVEGSNPNGDAALVDVRGLCSWPFAIRPGGFTAGRFSVRSDRGVEPIVRITGVELDFTQAWVQVKVRQRILFHEHRPVVALAGPVVRLESHG